MSQQSGHPSRGVFARLTLAQRGWLLLATALVVTTVLSAAGLLLPAAAVLLALAMSAGLVLGLSPVLTANRAAPATFRGFSGRVPPSWEYYETFGR